MTLIIEKPTTSKLILAKDYVGIDDPDAAVYIAAVEAADEAESPGVGALETATKVAIHSFVKGCKNDGIWPAIKASCILAGARTLTGALVPLVGSAPSNNGPFASGDYNRKTGLTPNGSTAKWLNSNYSNDANSRRNDNHQAIWVSQSQTNVFALGTGSAVTGATTISFNSDGAHSYRNMQATASAGSIARQDNRLVGSARSNSSNFTGYADNTTEPFTSGSDLAAAENIGIFRRSTTAGTEATTSRFAYYSLGNSLNLTHLSTRVSALITAIGAAF
jgi:hypothetical protein